MSRDPALEAAYQVREKAVLAVLLPLVVAGFNAWLKAHRDEYPDDAEDAITADEIAFEDVGDPGREPAWVAYVDRSDLCDTTAILGGGEPAASRAEAALLFLAWLDTEAAS